MKPKEKRNIILHKYSKQLETLSFQTEEGEIFYLEDYYICPLCLKTFNLIDLSEEEKDILSLEDIPPKALGGKATLVTCKTCNNTCGHKVDSFLTNELEYRFGEKKRSSDGQRVILSTGENKTNAILSIGKEKDLIFHFHGNPKQQQKSLHLISTLQNYGSNWNLNMTLLASKEKKRNNFAAKVALLKTAYLFAFERLGYSYILNDSLTLVREQIFNPGAQILHNAFLIDEDNNIPQTLKDGVYIAIINNTEIVAVLTSYKIFSSGYKYRVMVALPFPDIDTDSFYFSLSLLRNADVSQRHIVIKGIAQCTTT